MRGYNWHRMTIDNDKPRYDNDRPETYCWHLVPNGEVREWAALVNRVINDPGSMGNYAEWPNVVDGIRMSMRLMARVVEAVPFSEQIHDAKSD